MSKASSFSAVAVLVVVWSLSGCGDAHDPVDAARAGGGASSSAGRSGASTSAGSSGATAEDGGTSATGGASDDAGAAGAGTAGGAGVDGAGMAGGAGADDAGESRSVGPEGGTLAVAGADLIVPAGALSDETALSITVLGAAYPELAPDDELRSVVIALQPHGQTFLAPVSLTLPFTGSSDPGLRLITAEPGGTWTTVEGARFEGGAARVEVLHFSLFAVVAKRLLRVGCKLVSETSMLPGNQMNWVYSYDSNGRLSKVDAHYLQGNGIRDTAEIGDLTVLRQPGPNTGNVPVVTSTRFEPEDLLYGFPTRSEVAYTEQGITRTDVNSWWYYYDDKGRIKTVGQQTDHVVGDNEYDLDFVYDDQDNAIAMTFKWTTGPNTMFTIGDARYDDKTNPFASIGHYYNVMHAAWDNYDSGAVFMAVSAHNLLRFVGVDGTVQTSAYEYNEHGLPVSRWITNTAANGNSASYGESYAYECF